MFEYYRAIARKIWNYYVWESQLGLRKLGQMNLQIIRLDLQSLF